jgi:fucose 4-O-acetylase-like acetyltransferase
MLEQNSKITLEEDLCIHIFTVSAAMVGVCLTVIGLIRIVITIQRNDTLADDLLAADALLFLTSCIMSYVSLRTRKVRRMHRVERIADMIFLAAILLMAGVCLFITYAIATAV